jgi:hypothetical protein
MRWLLLAGAVALFGVAAAAVWSAVHSPAFWTAVIAAIASAIGGAIAPVIARDFSPENAKRVRERTRRAEPSERGGKR